MLSVNPPHFPLQRSVLALVALTCLVGPAATTAALAQQPDPAPLWKAFPLSSDKSSGSRPAEPPNGPPAQVAETPPPPASAESAARDAAPLAVTVAFYFALAGLAAIGVGAATVHVMRRRARPITCEISWSPGDEGDAFRATAQLGGQEEWVVAQSRRFQRRSPEPPEYDDASHAAYDQLLRDLYADGWLPYERGREWWAMRLRRTANLETTSTPTRDG
jgi:hypothetical protein